jgi:hypothetical protein
MNKGTITMGALAVIITGGYFGYDYYQSKKKKEEHKAWSPDQGKGKGGSAGSGDGEGSGSEPEAATHKVQRLQLPRLLGLTPAQATAKLVALGYKPDVLEIPENMGCHYEDEQRDIVPVGTICDQDRSEGEVLMSNAKLRVVVEHDTWEHGGVEADNEWRRMPNLEGMSLAQAKELLRSKGFSDDEFTIGEARTSCGQGLVCEQRPKVDGRKYARELGELNVGN